VSGQPRAYWCWLVLLLALVAGCWAWAFPGCYLYDDFAMPLGDRACLGLGTWWARGLFQLRLLTKLTFALESTLGLGSASARRANSLAIHLAGVALLWRVLRERWQAGARTAFLLALIYGIHPIHAESVLALAGRSSALATALVLAALLAHDPRRRWRRVLLLVMAVLARETALAAGVALVLFDSPAERSWRARFIGAGLLAGLTALWTALVPRYRDLLDYSFLGRPWSASTVAQVAAIPHGLSLYLRPWALSADHGEALPKTPWHPLFLAGAALLAVALFCLWRTRRDRLFALPLALWLAAIVPTQTVIPKLDALTERPLAAALPGIILLLASLSAAVTALRWRRILGILAAGVAAALACACIARATLYRSELAFWADAAGKRAVSTRSLLNHATILMDARRFSEAREVLERARQRSPLHPLVQAKLRYLDLRQ